ncbi:MAG: NADH-quinone oxidoreductase subunit L [Planctomycetes bacterium]|nr:NADH-quinone oxidoreductase subunit L [Planctomycetota bacterium]
MSGLEIMLVLGVAAPLLSFLLLALFGSQIGKPWAGWVATAAMSASTLLATVVLIKWQGLAPADRPVPTEFTWAALGSIPVNFGVNLDSLSVIMFFMVSFVSTCIFVFSIGYMAGHSDEIDGQSKFHRFFAYLSLFGFSMLGLVISNNLLLLFVFWELVGVCSYLLIGFYFHKKSASDAAIKAFVVNRVGDMGFIIGLAMVYLYLGDLSLTGAAAAFAGAHDDGASPLFTQTLLGLSLATWMGMLLFCGAIGKSAQFPLHVWLPDAMEGPTPVSALIHAATMVAAGVYLVARIFVLLTPQAQTFIAIIGCITLTIAALVAIVQTDIKKVLAYSTISQLGYMILGMGVGAWVGALFHLLTHAFFKALMFLGSGQVIEGCHHEQDMRRMGGLRTKMPVTCWTFFVGVLAIAGVGIPAVWMPGHKPLGLGGYFSKDEILAVAYERVHGGEHAAASYGSHDAVTSAVEAEDHGLPSPGGHDSARAVTPPMLPRWLFWIPIIIAYVTPFYMMRCWWMTFMGKPRDRHVYEHAHESPLMYIPLVVLAIGTVFSSYWLFRPMVADAVPAGFLVPSIDGEKLRHAHTALAGIVGGAFVVGFLVAILIYRKGLDLATMIARAMWPIHTVLEHKFYFDELYGLVLVGGTHAIKAILYAFDKWIVDGMVNLAGRATAWLARFTGNVLDTIGVDGAVDSVGRGTMGLGEIARTPQVGRIRNYVLFAVGTAAVVLVVMVWQW